MVSFFRRKKPDPATEPSVRRFTTEELAAAFPGAQPVAPASRDTVPPAETASAEPEPPREVTAEDRSTASLSEASLDAATSTALPAEPVPPEVIAAAMDVEPPFEPSPVASPSEAAQPRVAPPEVASPKAASPEPATPVAVPAAEPPPAAPGKTGWRERLRGSTFARSFVGLFSRNPKLDDDLLDEIETALITADVGVTATSQLIENLRKRMKGREFADANALLTALRADLIALLRPVAQPLRIDEQAKPFVLLTVGVNGVGKTTTIGKLAKRFRDEKRSLMLAAGDTFRAAAVAQLQAWGDRNGVPVVAQGQNADAASVAFDALQAAKARGTEVLIADTAGRLHTQQGLMAELGKIRRVLGKIDATAPHEVLMVIDGTTGQNALSQLRQFHAAVGVTGLVVTKLDGTAKGGVVFALAREFGIPIRYAGIGERPEDLRVFDAEAFVDALLPERLGG